MGKLLAIVVLCLVGATLSKAAVDKAAMIKEFMEFSDQCKIETGASKDDVNDFIKQQPARTMAGKCYRACILKKYKVMDNNGKFVRAVALEHAENLADGDAEKMKIATEVTDACVGLAVPADHCEAAEAYGKCLKEQTAAHGVDLNF